MSRLVGVLTCHHVRKDSGWGIGSFRVTECDDPQGPSVGWEITVVGNHLADEIIGGTLKLRATLDNHPRFGPQYKIHEQEAHGIVGSPEALLWLERLDGVGPILSRRIAKEFDDVVKVLDNPPSEGEPDELTLIDGIGDVVAKTIRDSWLDVGATGTIADLKYLAGLTHSLFEINAVISHLKTQRHKGKTAEQLLRQDPYDLTRGSGIKLGRVDQLAIAAGMAPDDPRRAEAAMADGLYRACQSRGNTYCDLEFLYEIAYKLIGLDREFLESGLRLLVEKDRVQLTEYGAHPKPFLIAEQEILAFARRRPSRRGLK